MQPEKIAETLTRIEAKLDKVDEALCILLAALAEDADDEEAPQLTLDGTAAGATRDATQSL